MQQSSLFPDGATVLTVSQVTEQLRDCVESAFPAVWVEGEITNWKVWSSGHAYFSLTDKDAVLKSVMYAGQVARLQKGFEPRDGMSVIALGRISVYAKRGDYQLIVERMAPKGIGPQELELRQLKEKLFKLGYFDPGRKRHLPAIPRCVCAIASPQGAAIRDIIKILGRRWPATRLLFQPSRVQGEGAAEEIAAAIRQVNRWTGNGDIDPELIILARGGGSSEDLWAFNLEPVARAIFESQLPIVSAVGHEIDMTIADLVADVRASTPSHAAELIVPDRAEILQQVQDQRDRLVDAGQRKCELLRRQVEQLAARRVFLRPTERVRDLERRVDEWSERLTRGIHQRLERLRQSTQAAAGRLGSLSPLNVLARGYSLTQTEATGKIVRSAQDVAVGERLRTVVHQGRIVSRVETTEPAEAERVP